MKTIVATPDALERQKIFAGSEFLTLK